MKFRYIGDPKRQGDGPQSVSFRGYTFPKGQPVEVDDAKAIEQLTGNSHFEQVKSRAKQSDATE